MALMPKLTHCRPVDFRGLGQYLSRLFCSHPRPSPTQRAFILQGPVGRSGIKGNRGNKSLQYVVTTRTTTPHFDVMNGLRALTEREGWDEE